MAQVIFLPHAERCPKGGVIEAEVGDLLIEVAFANGIDIEHACEMACACTTCHVIVKKGFNSLDEASDSEEDMLDKAWGLEPESRLSCQIIVGSEDLEIELPKYTINMVSENN